MLVHRRVTPSIKFTGTHLYTWVKRGTVRVKCLAILVWDVLQFSDSKFLDEQLARHLFSFNETVRGGLNVPYERH